jgi:hypothetical protein
MTQTVIQTVDSGLGLQAVTVRNELMLLTQSSVAMVN